MKQLISRERYLEQASNRYHQQLKAALRENPGNLAGSYLFDHGLDVKDNHVKRIITKYRLGLVVNPINNDDKRHFNGMLAIPYITKVGVKALRFRNLNGNKPKIAQATGQKARLYNTNAYFNADTAVGLAEGEIDAIVATEFLGIPTIGIPGAEHWTAYRHVWAPGFKNFQTVFVFTDGDPINPKTNERPGEELGKAIQESLGFKVRIITSPEGEDVSSMVANGRAEYLLDQMKEETEEDD